MRETKYVHRYVAGITIKTSTPLSISNGDKDIDTDSIISRDINGLPYIPGSTIAGVVKSAAHIANKEDFFGALKKDSLLIFSEGKILDSFGNVVDNYYEGNDPLLEKMTVLPIRQHVKINSKGVAVNKGKFDNQIVYAGARFYFEVEMLARDNNQFEDFKKILAVIKEPSFRIGGGSRKGYGGLDDVQIWVKDYNLDNDADLKAYMQKSSALSLKNIENFDKFEINQTNDIWEKICIEMRPQSFFLFGSGFSDDDADMTPIKASVIDWTGEQATLVDNLILMPGSSLKGAIAHRVAFHYNRFSGENKVGIENIAVRTLFGSEKLNAQKAYRGNVIISDIIKKMNVTDKALTHVSIDRFTGGGIEGALFQEKATWVNQNEPISFQILVNKESVRKIVQTEVEKDSKVTPEQVFANIEKAFDTTLNDLVNGYLPLGGGVNRGNGIFKGSIKK